MKIRSQLKYVATSPCEILIFKIAPTESTAMALWQTKRACTEKNIMTAVDKLVLRQYDQFRQIAQSTVVRIIAYWTTDWNRRPSDTQLLKQLLSNVIFVWYREKGIHISHIKNIQND